MPVVQEKITLKRARTLAETKRNITHATIKHEVLKFADGSLRVTIPDVTPVKRGERFVIQAYLENMDDLMVVAQIKDIVDRLTHGLASILLKIMSPLYSRYDRVMFEDQSDAFGAAVFGKMVQSLGFTSVSYLDCHSRVLVSQTGIYAHDIVQSVHLATMQGNYPAIRDAYTIAPDKGAVKKNPIATLVFDKVRDVTTGKIQGVSLVERTSNILAPDRDYLVVDDLCEGGRTFIEVAKEFNKALPNHKGKLSLYVTHGLFTNNAIPKLLEAYSDIYVRIMKKTTLDQLTPEQRAKVHVSLVIV